MKHINKIINAKILSLTAALFFSAATLSCSSEITIKANSDASSSISVNLAAGNSISSVLKALFGSTSLSQIASAQELTASLRDYGITDAQASFPTASSTSLKGTLPGNSGSLPFVSCTSSSLTLTLSPETLFDFFAALPYDAQCFMDLFIPPVYTGEEMTADEYRELLAAFYGDELAQEIDEANITLKLCCPDGKKIKGTADTQRIITIPLIQLFTLDHEVSWSISFE